MALYIFTCCHQYYVYNVKDFLCVLHGCKYLVLLPNLFFKNLHNKYTSPHYLGHEDIFVMFMRSEELLFSDFAFHVSKGIL